MHVVKPYVVTYAVFRLYHPPSRSKNDRCSPMCVNDPSILSYCERFGASNLQLLEKSPPSFFVLRSSSDRIEFSPSPSLRTLSSRQRKQKPELEIRVKGRVCTLWKANIFLPLSGHRCRFSQKSVLPRKMPSCCSITLFRSIRAYNRVCPLFCDATRGK